MEPHENKIAPSWRPLNLVQRRVLGVLIEKAKTTPDGYPLTLNSIVTGANQKSNRDPQTDLRPDQVEDALEKLRSFGAVSEVFGSGRVPKYKHHCYEWFGVETDELAIVAELLLRGSQSLGDLRARAARMTKIAGLEELRPLVQSLMAKKLMVSLTPEGRGQMVTHNLWQPEELARQRQKFGSAGGGESWSDSSVATVPTPAIAPVGSPPAQMPAAPASGGAAPSSVAQPSATSATIGSASSPAGGDVSQLRSEVAELRAEVARLRQDVQDLWDNLK